MATLRSKISTEVDFTQDGKQIGYLRAPHSTNEAGWGTMLMPIVVIRNGPGPTVLLTGASHGDEFEGPITLMKLARSIEPEQIRGRIIILPALNYPALRAGTRLSPVDGRNMNRVFPGDRDGTLTLMIAHYVHTELLPLADVVVDLHSGGNSMIFEPCVVMHRLDDMHQFETTLAAVRVFGSPVALVLQELDSAGMLDSAVEEMGKVFISTELGGGGFVTARSLAIAERGVLNLLRHFQVLDGMPELPEDVGEQPTRLMEVPDDESYTMAPVDGLYEVMVEVGEPVRNGTILGKIHDVDYPAKPPEVITARRDGWLLTRAGRGWVTRGATIAVVGCELEL